MSQAGLQTAVPAPRTHRETRAIYMYRNAVIETHRLPPSEVRAQDMRAGGRVCGAKYHGILQRSSNTHLSPAACRSVGVSSGVGAVSGRCRGGVNCDTGVGVSEWCRTWCRAVSSHLDTARSYISSVVSERRSEKGPCGQFGPRSTPDVNVECSHRVVWVLWPCDNTQFTLGRLGISWGRIVLVVPFHSDTPTSLIGLHPPTRSSKAQPRGGSRHRHHSQPFGTRVGTLSTRQGPKGELSAGMLRPCLTNEHE